MQIVIVGYGKMGKEIERLAIQSRIAIRMILKNREELIEALPDIRNTDICIEFTHPKAAFKNLMSLGNQGLKVISGTTGWLDKIDEVNSVFERHGGSFFYSSNFSIGMNIMFVMAEALSQMTAKMDLFETSIVESHHKDKNDAPSGTAISLAQSFLHFSEKYKSWSLHPESGNELRIHSIRKENVYGIHELICNGRDERISIRHEAKNRTVFAKGALNVALWLSQRNGIFSMRDFLQL